MDQLMKVKPMIDLMVTARQLFVTSQSKVQLIWLWASTKYTSWKHLSCCVYVWLLMPELLPILLCYQLYCMKGNQILLLLWNAYTLNCIEHCFTKIHCKGREQSCINLLSSFLEFKLVRSILNERSYLSLCRGSSHTDDVLITFHQKT